MPDGVTRWYRLKHSKPKSSESMLLVIIVEKAETDEWRPIDMKLLKVIYILIYIIDRKLSLW